MLDGRLKISNNRAERAINPFCYLTYLFEKLPNIDLENIEKLDQLLPWLDSIPKNCKVPNRGQDNI